MTRDFASILAAAGIRPTAERLRLLRLLASRAEPASSKALHEASAGASDRVTIYRNLETFVKAGLARRVDVGHRHAHYELTSDRDHHHLICTGCGRIEDVAYCPSPTAIRNVLAKSARFASVERHALEFYGTCVSCAKRR